MKAVVFLLAGLCLAITPSAGQSKSAQNAYRKAVAYLNKGKTQKGFGYLDNALHTDSTYREAWYAKGYYAFDQGDYPQALVAFDKLVQLYPRDTTFYRYRALTNLYLNDYERAEQDLQQALQLDSQNPDTYNDLGYVYYQWDKPQEAHAQFNKSLQLQENNTALYYKALVYYDQAQHEQAMQLLDKALKADVNYVLALRLKANILADQKQYAPAIKIYEQLANSGDLAEPNDLLNWGLIYYRMKKYGEALVYFKTPENHQSSTLYYYTGLTHYRLKQQAEALQSLNQAAQYADTTDEAYAPLFYDRAIVRFAANDRKGAVADFLRAAYLLPEITKRQNAKGDTLELLGSAPILLKGTYSQRQLDQACAAGYRNRVEALLESEEGEAEALKTAQRAVQLDSSNAEGYFTRGRVHYLQGEHRNALHDYNRGFHYARGKTDAYHYYLRGLAHYETEQYEQAYEDLSEAIRLNGKESAYYYDRAYALAALGDYEEAVKDITQAMVLEQDDTSLLLTRAGLYNDMKRFAEALTDCNLLLQKDANNAMAYCVRGYANEGLKQKEQAIADYSKALQLEPQLEDARIALEELSGLRTTGQK